MAQVIRRKWLIRGLIVVGFVGLVALLFLWTVVGRVSDLRPQAIKSGISPEAERRGLALIAEMEKALGGYAKWRAKRRGMFLMEAIWHNKIRKFQWTGTHLKQAKPRLLVPSRR